MSSEQLIDLDKKQFRLLKSIIKQHIPYKEIWAYGSRVQWKANERSDLDLVVFDCNTTEVSHLREAFEESDLLISVAVMDWKNTPEDFRKKIKEKYVVLQKKRQLDDWQEMKLGGVAEINNGKRNSQDAISTGEYPLFDRSVLIKKSDKYLFDKEAVIIPGEGKEFIPRYYYGKFDLHQRCYAIHSFDKDLFPKFCYYYLVNNKEYFNSVAVGSTVLSLRLGHFQTFPISFPPFPKQKAIAEVLSSLDDKIDLLHRQNKTLEDIAQTLFRKWFIEDADEGWEEKKLSSKYQFKKGVEPGSKYYQDKKTENNIRFIRVGNMQSNVGDIFIDKSLFKENCKESDLLVSFDGTVGRVTYGKRGVYSSGIRKIFSSNPIYNSFGFKYLLFTNKNIQNTIQAHATGTVILHAGSSIDFLVFALPEDKIIKKFNTLVDSYFNKILNNQSQVCSLEKLRDILLPKLMTGKAIIKDLKYEKTNTPKNL